MFGDLMGMMGKLKESQEKVKATRERLATVTLEESSSDGLLGVTVSASREIRDIRIADELLQDKEQLADYLVTVLNKALKKAGDIHDTELAAAAREGMPDIPGLDNFLK
ncbi:YbaB/EbfC family nucleoid-associated protein [Robiginitalea sp. SC105]|uniref:YbaB/EbfC family nucleoid-associated protein n=1 Tax=Robiginitalea sp. SC105 TaxID=2762332 RepID=UPI00163A62A2|nr:YbaB/EbfC family nucleoid-associated protein [Robiginitalea sp. SC105]MBC2840679.1 YbaB/EbfC family nucleoid-associated protein [Robiginitalea sp. SC105]